MIAMALEAEVAEHVERFAEVHIWAAPKDAFSGARRQACWVHKVARVLDSLPKRLAAQGNEPAARDHGGAVARGRSPGAGALPRRVRPQIPERRVAKLDRDRAALTAFYDFPAEHWRDVRTSNAIESSFATVKLRTRVTKGAGPKEAALAMACKLLGAPRAPPGADQRRARTDPT
jgi:transposase-like protein